ncbi:unnamed protein product [Taenia asiatica]|uniref:Secreted protein n=1 Tax=Taenia asiatica TaxID=60517 RepID=A0A0R3VY68_TAEAS|nr:unnamed protein product [Taenia asiatica]
MVCVLPRSTHCISLLTVATTCRRWCYACDRLTACSPKHSHLMLCHHCSESVPLPLTLASNPHSSDPLGKLLSLEVVYFTTVEAVGHDFVLARPSRQTCSLLSVVVEGALRQSHV